jgi:hypothetical protein
MAIALFRASRDVVLETLAESMVGAGSVEASNVSLSEFAEASQLIPITQTVSKASFVFIRCGVGGCRLWEFGSAIFSPGFCACGTDAADENASKLPTSIVPPVDRFQPRTHTSS